MKAIGIGSIAWLLILATSGAQAPFTNLYRIDSARSRIELTVFRGGLLKLFGHDHAIAAKRFSGQVRFDPENIGNSSVRLDIEAGSLVVLDDPGVSEKDRKQIQADMEGAKVLDVRQYPQITFHSTEVSRTPTARDRLMLRGRLNLHGVEKEIAFPIQIHSETSRLSVTGTVVVDQREFGIKPIRIAAGGLRVKDKVNVKFEIVAEKAE